ncbi:MAG: DUF4252 domain-containing protein [Thermoanaerobaculales bacterium]|nr:DUF4252 domain-containing protein [Thermoanaerobaculales bacterium]
MNIIKRSCIAAALCAIAAIPASAQTPGVVAVEDLGLVDPTTLEVDVNLEGTTLQIAAGAMQDQDPRLVELVTNLSRVRVMVGKASDPTPADAKERIDGAVAQLESRGWSRIVRVEDGTELVNIYSLDGGDGKIAGLTAFVSGDGDETVVVNIAGSIDPVLLGSVLSRLGQLDLDELMSAMPEGN